MLNVPFFIATFTSVFWMFYSVKQFHLTIFSTSTPEQIYQTVFILFFPLAIIWGIVALIKSHCVEREFFRYIYLLADQIKKNTESTANLEQVLLGSVQTLKNGVTLQEFNALIADTNEILSDIIKRSNSVSSSQLEHLWNRTAGGERWLLAKTFIEINNYQTGFVEHLETKANKDSLLKGSILEFTARYKTLYNLLENQDTKKIFYNMIEYGALGKVYEILATVASNLTAQREAKKVEQPVAQEDKNVPTFTLTEEPMSFPSFLSQSEESSAPMLQGEEDATDVDEGLRAVREEILITEPKSAPIAPIVSGFSQTESALRRIHVAADNTTPKEVETETKKAPVISLDELEKEINASPENNYDEYAYPFGAWLNEKNNK